MFCLLEKDNQRCHVWEDDDNYKSTRTFLLSSAVKVAVREDEVSWSWIVRVDWYDAEMMWNFEEKINRNSGVKQAQFDWKPLFKNSTIKLVVWLRSTTPIRFVSIHGSETFLNGLVAAL